MFVQFRLALLLYRLLFLFLLPLILIIFVLRSLKNRPYRQRLRERFGVIPAHMKRHGIIVHAASVGEVIALKAFIEQLLIEYPDTPITITTFTPTGSSQVRKLFNTRVQHCYLPFDFWPASALFLYRLQPQAIIFMETELWPNLIAQCHSRDIKLMLINARLSDKSMRSYRKISWLLSPTIQKFDRILAQSQINLAHYLALGAYRQKSFLSGNLKFDISINADVQAKRDELSEFLPLNRKIWLVASTHPGDEKITLSAFETIKQHDHSILLVLVPRHPERFEQVAELVEQYGNSLIKRSEKSPVLAQTNVWLLDSLGELLAAYSLADVVTMGGSFSDIGGHNPLEPALFSKPVIVGPNMSNFSEVLTQLEDQQGIVQLHANRDFSTQLSEKVYHCLTDNAYSTALGESAFAVVKANQGASLKSIMQLKALLATNKSHQ